MKSLPTAVLKSRTDGMDRPKLISATLIFEGKVPFEKSCENFLK